MNDNQWALRIAAELDRDNHWLQSTHTVWLKSMSDAAMELRRLHRENSELINELEEQARLHNN